MTEKQTCLVTGASGYLGGRLKSALQQHAWNVAELTRNPQPNSKDIRFRLGHEVPAGDLKGATALVNCAYDFKKLSWKEIHAANVSGSEKLFEAAR